MPSYAGFDLGLVEQMNTIAAPKARQVNDYPGADGLEFLDHGSRGGSTPVSGAMGASTLSGLGSLLQGLRALQVAGDEATLVDLFGNPWTGVVLDQFAPVGRVYVGGPGFCQKYQALFLHRY